VAVGATVLAEYRDGRDRCLACGRDPHGRMPAAQPPRMVYIAAYLVVFAA
jgi:hypothetical protein